MNVCGIPASKIRVGDAIVFAGQEHRVARIEKYDGPLHDLGAFAVAWASDGWCMTLWRNQLVEVAA